MPIFTRREFIAGLAVLGAGAAHALPFAGMAHAVLIESPIACGRFLGIDKRALLPQDAGRVLTVLCKKTGDSIDYRGEPLGLLVAEDPAAAALFLPRLAVLYESRPAVLTTPAALESAHLPRAPTEAVRDAPAWDYVRGYPEAALAEAPAGFLLRQTYVTAPEQPPPPPLLSAVRGALETFATQALKRPVQVALSPQQAELLGGHRPETIQTLTIAAGHDGGLRALFHRSLSDTAMASEYVEPCAIASQHLYGVEHVRVAHAVVRKNIAPRAALVAAGLAPGLFALESALDELATLLKLDPVRLRLLNHAEVDPVSGAPWAGKRLRECYRLGMERIGWSERPPDPRALREGSCWVGIGMAGTTTFVQPAMGGAKRAGFGAHFVRLLVDPEKKTLRIARHVVVLDAGTQNDPKQAEATVKAAVALGHRAALVEAMDQEAAPSIEPLFVEKDRETAAPLAPETLRDLAFSGVAAAVANAVFHAVAVRCRALPIVQNFVMAGALGA